jgi:hypothetical protein
VDVERFVAKADASYSSPTMQDFVAVLPDVIWELEAEPDTPSGNRRFKFHRKAGRKGEDAVFEGPRQARQRKGDR